MELFLRNFFSARKISAFLSVLVLGLAREVSAQNTPITDYADLVNALNAGVTTITNFQSPLTISLTTVAAPTIQITNNVTINAGTNSVIFQGNGTNGGTRFFYVHTNASLTLDNLMLTNGGSTNGGAIYNAGTLIISNCVLAGNYATNSSGANGGSGSVGNGTNGGGGGMAEGGAIYSIGPVIISSSILSNNIVEAGDGGNGGNAGGTVGNGGSAGNGGNAYGGALYTTGSSNILYMTEFAGNQCFAGNGGSGGVFATNGPEGPSGSGGATGVGGSCAGGAAFVAGSLYMTNCLFFANFAVGGSTGTAEVDSDNGGINGSPGGSAFGGALFITNKVAGAWIENSIFFTNACYAGGGGLSELSAFPGGDGGDARGGAVWSGATLTQMAFCTMATNYVVGGAGGTNTDGGSLGAAGAASGYVLYRSAGVFDLYASILSYDYTGTSYPNAAGVTDLGYNVSSDASLTKSTIITTTKLNTNPDLNSGLSATGTNVGGPFSSPFYTLTILINSPAAGFVPGVPGSTFPATDEALQDRSTPTSAGAFEYNAITSIQTNVVPANLILSTLPGTNLTGANGSVAFTNTINSQIYSNAWPLGYQWQLDGTNIYDDGNYSGTASNILTVKKITIFNQGAYTVIISPTLLEGAVTSSPPVELILTNPPVIEKQPVSQIGRPVGAIVTFTLGVASPLNFNYIWMMDGTNLVPGTNSNVLTIDPALPGDAGTYSVIVSNNYGVKKSVNVRLTVVPDHARPTVTITSPLSNVRTNAPVFAGAASDNAQVTNVMYWFTNINAGLIPVTNVMSGYATLTNANTNLNGPNKILWSITNVPLPGTNILAVQSVDYSSNVSPIVTRRFFYEVPSVLTLTTNVTGGAGTLAGHAFFKGDTAPSNNASLNIGEEYTIVAAPNATSLLGNWTNMSGTNMIVTNGNTLKFIMESNTAIQALFVTNIFLEAGGHGTFNGLFYALPEFVTNEIATNQVVGTNGMTNEVVSTNAIYTNEVTFESSGMLNNLVLGEKGSFSGRLLLAGGSYALSGAFDAFGHLTNHVVSRTAKLGGPLILDMDLDTNGSGIITGAVSNASWPTNAYLWASLASTAPGTTNYTMLMAPPTNAEGPSGDGYTLITDRAGKVTLTGGLADGTTFSQSVPASQSNDVPVYVSLYGKTGFLFGWLNLTNLTGTNAVDDLVWIKETPARPSLLFPDGFTNMQTTAGSVWTNPGVITLPPSSTLDISNADLDLDYTVAIDDPDKLVNASSSPANLLSGTINLNTGLLKITFGNGDGGSTTRGYGAMLQDIIYAGGYFVIGTNAGSVILNGSGQTPSLLQPEETGPTRAYVVAQSAEALQESNPMPPLPPVIEQYLNNSNSPPGEFPELPNR
jgi:hypothetical protein